MENTIVELLTFQNQLRILHWQTFSFARHKAFNKTYNDLDELIDTFVECYQGKYQRFSLKPFTTIEIANLDDVDIDLCVNEMIEFLSTRAMDCLDPIKDTELFNIRDEILGTVDRLKYFLTFK
jgi:DNA-binding ferritin-like protein